MGRVRGRALVAPIKAKEPHKPPSQSPCAHLDNNIVLVILDSEQFRPHDRRVRKQGNAVPSGGKQRLPRRQLMPVTRRADQPRSGRKKARMSSASSSGCSIAAKWPPRGITVQRRILV